MQMMYTIARYYSTSEHMTRLFTKLTNQMIRKCKEQITFVGKLWDQDKPTLISNMKVRKHGGGAVVGGRVGGRAGGRGEGRGWLGWVGAAE